MEVAQENRVGSTDTLPIERAQAVRLEPLIEPLPELLVASDGNPVNSSDAWQLRRAELVRQFTDLVYGPLPDVPESLAFTSRRLRSDALAGQATLDEVVVHSDPELRLLLIRPNTPGPQPVFVGLNRAGNHTVVDDPSVSKAGAWRPRDGEEEPSTSGRGERSEHWSADLLVSRGYALATLCARDVMPDRADAEGPGGSKALSAWAWGLHRAVDYLVQDPGIDPRRVAAFGHSRRGKAALWAAANDDRIGLVVPNMAGCMGPALSRHPVGESVHRLNTDFPHWLNDYMDSIGDDIGRLPLDQHQLVATVAPRSILLTQGAEDEWADPGGAFLALQAAEPVYRLLGSGEPWSSVPPRVGEARLDSPLGYVLIEGPHRCDREIWSYILDYADRRLARTEDPD